MAKYIDIIKIGSGGFGKVFKCERDTGGGPFAKKKLIDQAGEDEIRRFVREVRILSSLDHSNIIKVIGTRLEKAPYFYIMPLYGGSLLDEFPQIVLDEKRIKIIFSSVLDAVEYSHGQGVVHRDLKPQNILLNSDNDIVVSDFGLGRIFDSDSTRQTQNGDGLGTPLYMASEQIRDAKNADERSDIFSLGRILQELYGEDLTMGSADMSSVPPHVSVIIRRCIDSNPEKRFQSVSELKMAWLSIFDSSALAEQLDQLEEVISNLAIASVVEESDAQELLQGLLNKFEDVDLVKRAIMTVNPAVFGLIERIDVAALRTIIDKFVEHITSQGWGFDYTDKIGNTCKAIYYQVKDFEIRASLIYCVTELGTLHNRWHVMNIAGNLLCDPKVPGESIPIKDKLGKLTMNLYVLENYIKKEKLDPLLLTLFKGK